MAALTRDNPPRVVIKDTKRFPIEAAEIMYLGAFAQDNGSTGVQGLSGSNAFVGVCLEHVDNATGAAGDAHVLVCTRGTLERRTLVGFTGFNNLGDTVYASDDQTLTASSTNNSAVGKIANYHSDDGTFDVAFEAAFLRSL